MIFRHSKCVCWDVPTAQAVPIAHNRHPHAINIKMKLSIFRWVRTPQSIFDERQCTNADTSNLREAILTKEYARSRSWPYHIPTQAHQSAEENCIFYEHLLRRAIEYLSISHWATIPIWPEVFDALSFGGIHSRKDDSNSQIIRL